jgi:hypothetical protein
MSICEKVSEMSQLKEVVDSYMQKVSGLKEHKMP